MRSRGITVNYLVDISRIIHEPAEQVQKKVCTLVFLVGHFTAAEIILEIGF